MSVLDFALTFTQDLDPMMFIHKLELGGVQMYLSADNKLPSYSSSKIKAQIDTQTDGRIDRQTWLKLLTINICGW